MIIDRYKIEYHGPGDDNQRIKDQGWRVYRASWMSPEARRKGRYPRLKLVFVDESMVEAVKYVKEPRDSWGKPDRK